MAASCSRGAPASTAATPGPRGPLTRAERTRYLETSRYADVVAFLDSLHSEDATLAFGSIGRTTEGRDIPYVIASRPLVRTPRAARATGKPIVYVQANIHAGEVEGKEALLALVRDLAYTRGPSVLDSIVLIAVPIYNADGNEKLAPQERQRTEQNGPALVGQRPNAMGLDLNRDYIKAEAPETRASLAMFNTWDPDVFVDLHTTDGSFHGYALTYSPSLSPASPLADYSRTLLSELRTRVRAREGYETFDYGNFEDPGGEVSTDTVHTGWYTYDARPRFGTNYYGLRNRIAVLSEAFSHDPFERRVRSTYAFTRQLLSLVAERGREIRLREQQAEAPTVASGALTLSVRSALPPTAPLQPVRYEILARTGDSSRTEAGVPRGLRRTGEFRTRQMPVFDRFVSTATTNLPAAYLVPASDTTVVSRLRAHGVSLVRLEGELDTSGRYEAFVIDSVVRSPRPFQGHSEVRLTGAWRPVQLQARGPQYLVDTHQPLARLAAYLLDPESEDSFGTWNAFDDRLGAGKAYPIVRRTGR
ncbi:MAG: peptidase carboxypeptidase [Gemmatimonadetes bacterium]|nr:peptidase carboxypeptidase [Gemmatimonadota bacterium]